MSQLISLEDLTIITVDEIPSSLSSTITDDMNNNYLIIYDGYLHAGLMDIFQSKLILIPIQSNKLESQEGSSYELATYNYNPNLLNEAVNNIENIDISSLKGKSIIMNEAAIQYYNLNYNLNDLGCCNDKYCSPNYNSDNIDQYCDTGCRVENYYSINVCMPDDSILDLTRADSSNIKPPTPKTPTPRPTKPTPRPPRPGPGPGPGPSPKPGPTPGPTFGPSPKPVPPAPPVPIPKGLLLGGWNNCQNDTWKPEWGCNTLLIGPYGGKVTNADTSKYKNVIWTVGGQGVSASTSTLNSMSNDITSYNAKGMGKINGVCFDCEDGSFKTDQIHSWMQSNKAALQKIGIIYFILCADYPNNIGDDGTFTHYAIMSYTGNTTYPTYDHTIDACSNMGTGQWVSALSCEKSDGKTGNTDCKSTGKSWASSKIILCFQSVSLLYGGKCQNSMASSCKSVPPPSYANRDNFATWVVDILSSSKKSKTIIYGGGSAGKGSVTLTGPIAGLFGWCAQTNKGPCFPNMDKLNWDLFKSKGLNISTGPTPAPAPTPPTPPPTSAPTCAPATKSAGTYKCTPDCSADWSSGGSKPNCVPKKPS